jgi:putative nucleotidyltransferase with HDIG domain
MLRVPVTEIRSGMRLARSVELPGGRLFLSAGEILRESYIEPLLRHGIVAVYVVNELAPDVMPPEVISEETRRQVTQELRQIHDDMRRAFAAASSKGLSRFQVGLNTERLKQVVGRVVDELLAQPRVVFNLQDIRTADEYTLGHSVSVCILSTLLGTVMGYTREELRNLALGALLHDIGKIMTPPEILNKPGKLTPEEIVIMNRHTVDGWEILKDQREMPVTAAIVALQHHERWLGGGYPEGLKGKQIYKFARVCAVADCFDAMTADRVYRPGMAPARALEILTREMKGFFQPELLWSFSQCVAPYPVGSLVTITGGQKAVVVAVTRGQTYKPRIRIVADAEGRPLAEPKELELAEHPEVRIVSLVREGPPELELSEVEAAR